MKKIILVTLATASLVIGAFLAYFEKQENQKSNDCNGQDLISYDVQDSKLVSPTPCINGPQWEPFIEQKKIHQELWKYMTDIIPPDLINLLDTCVFSAGNDSYTAFVQPTQRSSNEKWMININIKTMHNPLQMLSTFVHEFGHILTLNMDQIDYDEQEEDCPDRYIKGYGCSYPSSYINKFYNRFWKNIKKEWASYKDKQQYYKKHNDQYISPYAATDLTEDIAESFSGFVYSKKPLGATIADKKIAFFYEFPELVKLRAAILSRLNAYLSNTAQLPPSPTSP